MDTYPCAYLESPSFLRTMDVELARSDKRPAMLPQLDLARNNSIGFEDVQQFLMEEDHADLFKLMLACFLTREQDGALHRIIIRDSAENFNMWVAALQMALPVRQSLTYPFSTYEYDLLATDAHVVRAVDGMSGTLASLAVNAFVFDMDNEVPLPQPVADETVEQLCEFVADSMQYSPESLQAFHRFLDATDYTAADRGVADAYNLLQLSVGVMEFHELDVQSAGQALAFMRDHCGADVQRKVANQLFAEARANLLDDGQRELLRDVLAYIARNDRSYAVTARESALDLLFDVFTASDPKQAVYDQAYDIAHAVFDAIGQNVDVVLFDELTDNPEVNLGLNGTPGSALPWTVDAYARWTAQSILTAGGTAIRPGMPARQMQAALGQRNANALDKIIKVIVHHPDTAGTGMLVQEFAGTLSSNDLLGCMIDLLIILEGDPRPPRSPPPRPTRVCCPATLARRIRRSAPCTPGNAILACDWRICSPATAAGSSVCCCPCSTIRHGRASRIPSRISGSSIRSCGRCLRNSPRTSPHSLPRLWKRPWAPIPRPPSYATARARRSGCSACRESGIRAKSIRPSMASRLSTSARRGVWPTTP